LERIFFQSIFTLTKHEKNIHSNLDINRNSLMTHDKIASTRETLINDTDTLKQDAAKIVDDVKKHATAHVDVVKDRMNHTLDVARDCVQEHPLKVVSVALLIGFLIGTFRRK
jgi:ElaB/YqjD/DUF883 family membrane-anchored ribosome-binding protein